MTTTTKLQGHKAAVLCLDVSSPLLSSRELETATTSAVSASSHLLLSGSEDGTARLWDLRDHRRRACLCIRVPGGGDVLSAVFVPPYPALEKVTAAEETATIRSESNTFAKDCSVYLGVENKVLEYDLRYAKSPVVFSDPTRDWGKVLQNQDEVNQIGLTYYSNNHNGNSTSGGKKKRNQKKKGGGGSRKRQQASSEENRRSLYLVACDDAGKARWTEAWTSSPETQNNDSLDGQNCNGQYGTSSTILHHDNHGVAVVPSCAFRPFNTNHHNRGVGTSLELATGGTDCKIQLWDLFRSKKPVSTFTIHQNNSEDGQSKPQVCNPPFVYSLTWSNDGKSLAAGLGDGTVGVFEINNRTLVQRHILVGSERNGIMHYAHESSIASVVYPSFSVPTTDRILCSSGSDGAIVVWDLGDSNDEQWNNDIDCDKNSGDCVAQLFPDTLLQKLCNKTSTKFYNNGTSLGHHPRILFDISHGQKINWVTPAVPSSGTASSVYSDTIFVADTSPDITSYTIPF